MNALRNMHPFQIILIASFAVLALLGIFVFANYTNTNSGPVVGTVVIWGTLPETAVNDALNILKRGQNPYSAVTYRQISAATFDTDLANALASGSGPDMVIINQEELVTEEPRLQLIPFSSIPERTFLDTYVALDQEYLTANGTYGIPITVDPLVLYYNTRLLFEKNVMTPPTLWTTVSGLSSTLTKQSGDHMISQSNIAFGGYANVTNARAILSLLFLQTGSPITTVDNFGVKAGLSNTSVSGQSGNSGPAAAVDFYTEFANPSSNFYSWNPSLPPSRQMFIAQQLAFYPGFASEAVGLAKEGPQVEFDMAPIPQADGTTGRITYGLAYAFAIPKVAANKSGAFTVALALTSSTVLPTLAADLGQAPAKRALLTPKPEDRFTPIYYQEALNAKGWLSPAPATVDQIFSGIITSVTTGRLETPQALTNADQLLNAAL